MLRGAMLTVGLMGLAWAAGCDGNDTGTGQEPGGGRPRIALLMKARTNPFFARMADGARRKAEALGADLEVLAIDKETDTEKQAAQVETVTAKGVQAILIAPADSKAIIAPLRQARARGIKIINLDNRIDPELARGQGLEILAFVGPDNVEGARKSTAAMIQAMGGAGKVAMLEGIRGADNAEARKRGFEQAVKAAGGKVRVVVMDTAEWMTEPAQRKMESILNTHPDLKGVFCANDMMALGAISAIDSAGKAGQIMVAGYDNLQAARVMIKSGKLLATIEQHPDKMGALAVQYAVDAIQGREIPADIPVPTDLITIDDLK